MEQLERLLNLLTLLLESERPLTFERIRELIPAYQHGDVASAKRMFERDKDDLREVGVPLELTFTAEELAALFVAAASDEASEPAEAAVQKLSATSDARTLKRLSDAPYLGAVDPGGGHLRALAGALGEGRAVSFGYRRADGEEEARTVDPFGLVFRGGHWYLVGHDRTRDAVRAFRISRVTSAPVDAGEAVPVPEGFRAAEHVQTPGTQPEGTARVAFRERVAWWALSSVQGARETGRTGDWVEAEVPVSGRDAFVAWLAGFGPEARLLDAGELRSALVAHLEAAVEA
ncbi:MAG: WYL domain-containing protein, partial [Actinobacteria bacterium]|nr:WYL domain-containing protein [Actinomycetota bacterium]